MVQQAANIVTFCRRLFQNRIAPDDPWPHQVEDRWGMLSRTSLVNPSSHQCCRGHVWILLRLITFWILYLVPHFSKTWHMGREISNYQLARKLKFLVWCRTVISSRLVQLYLKYCTESAFEPLRRSTLFSIIKVCISVTVVSHAYYRCHYHILFFSDMCIVTKEINGWPWQYVNWRCERPRLSWRYH